MQQYKMLQCTRFTYLFDYHIYFRLAAPGARARRSAPERNECESGGERSSNSERKRNWNENGKAPTQKSSRSSLLFIFVLFAHLIRFGLAFPPFRSSFAIFVILIALRALRHCYFAPVNRENNKHGTLIETVAAVTYLGHLSLLLPDLPLPATFQCELLLTMSSLRYINCK